MSPSQSLIFNFAVPQFQDCPARSLSVTVHRRAARRGWRSRDSASCRTRLRSAKYQSHRTRATRAPRRVPSARKSRNHELGFGRLMRRRRGVGPYKGAGPALFDPLQRSFAIIASPLLVPAAGARHIADSAADRSRNRSGLRPALSASSSPGSNCRPGSTTTIAMANRAGARNYGAALVALAVLLAASMLAVGADAARWSHNHHHHSPPAPPGFDQPAAAPSPPYLGDGPAASPFAQSSWFDGGSDGPVAGAGAPLAPSSPLPWGGAPEAVPSLESGLY